MKQKEKKIEIVSASAGQTREIARLIGEKLQEGDVLALSGELGSGKTCFTGGLACGLGVDEKYRITSPTFTLINEYPARIKLYHFDVYRLKDYSEFEDLGYEEYFCAKGVVVIEWAEKITQILPGDALFINFEYLDENKRSIIIKGPENRLKEVIRDIKMEVV
ncbi:MAG: tRNA (adenosine(37)-N6)-threonylcarbamoyltransferase complex ATPase subunit type 1 TsaE [Deltaproteobacteria bacterium HGW-Deltaproteobacteria-7]|jgi:tRNA threonylcarbamoyladenosine biosynthesis protein TsaE|nr:MAG: tRNA (adenosine(37)-N6)-threonylcarbamoyltransferase complex ATPase subunit type 1 TsaE [Deltaproteobacteria bacterium HGW-Deltaproteobacteria-7]PKN52232.1 MAG: tRNA (adenosine(37)-N6)-threonylcarbamoyltransferase complex ATPase subunit type 1 TsaE [Deltaproteobacteria bacterium HGW-Deltaproteobacteria-13]